MSILCFCFIGLGSLHAQQTDKNKDMDREKQMHKDKEMHMDKNDNQKMGMVKSIIKDWPEHTQKAAEKTMEAYGTPSGITEKELIWYNVGPWQMVRLNKTETPHNFPVEHTDYLEGTIYHDVPVDKMSALGEFDGSVTFDRTQGHFSARCDMEANNFLALNLAHDIITGKMTVDEAREAYAETIKKKMNGEDPEYMKKLQFNPDSQDVAADADVNTTGLTKKEVMAAIKKNSKM